MKNSLESHRNLFGNACRKYFGSSHFHHVNNKIIISIQNVRFYGLFKVDALQVIVVFIIDFFVHWTILRNSWHLIGWNFSFEFANSELMENWQHSQSAARYSGRIYTDSHVTTFPKCSKIYKDSHVTLGLLWITKETFLPHPFHIYANGQ